MCLVLSGNAALSIFVVCFFIQSLAEIIAMEFYLDLVNILFGALLRFVEIRMEFGDGFKRYAL